MSSIICIVCVLLKKLSILGLAIDIVTIKILLFNLESVISKRLFSVISKICADILHNIYVTLKWSGVIKITETL